MLYETFEWEKEEKANLESLSKIEIEKRLEVMETMYIDRFAEHAVGLELLMFVPKNKDYLNDVNKCYSFLFENYKKRYKEEFKQLEYMKEVNEIYEILKELEGLIKEYSKMPKEEMKIYYSEKIKPKINRIRDLSKIWTYRLNLYRSKIGKETINLEVKKF